MTLSMTNGVFGSTRTAALERVGMVFPSWCDTWPRPSPWLGS
jgi:hypothetical protein